MCLENTLKSKYGIMINSVALIYLMLPILIFAFGWLKIYYACMVSAVFFIAFFYSLKDMATIEIVFDLKQVNVLLSMCVVVMIWVGLSGIGGISFQNMDHEIRNAIFHDLVQYPWPVIYHFSGVQSAQALAGHDGALVYYIAYWLPAALAGKLFGWKVANLALYLWTALGVLLSMYYLSIYVRKKLSFIVVIFFVFWSGLDAVGLLFQHYQFHLGAHIEWWATYFQYSSNTTTLFWVFNQTIVPWLVVMLMLNQRNNKNSLLLYALCVPYAPLPSIGLFPFVVYWIFCRHDSKLEEARTNTRTLQRFYNLLTQIRSMLTFQNIAVSLALGAFISSYFLVNSYIGNRYHGLLISIVHSPATLLWCYFLFCVLEFGLYTLIIFPFYKKEPLFLITVISLVLIPWYFAGVNNDFVMRASIPPLIILMTYVLRYLFDRHHRMAKLALVIFFGIGSVTPFNEIYRSVIVTSCYYSNRLANHVQSLSSFQLIKDVGPFVAIDPEQSFFFKYLGKAVPPK
jgi:hypothetical protein